MTENSDKRSTKVVAQPPAPANAVARERFERRVAAAVVLNGYSVSAVAEKFGVTAAEVREIFERRCPSAVERPRQ